MIYAAHQQLAREDITSTTTIQQPLCYQARTRYAAAALAWAYNYLRTSALLLLVNHLETAPFGLCGLPGLCFHDIRN